MEGGTEINTISVEPLLALGNLLGISQEVWENNEGLNSISYYNKNFSRDIAVLLTIDLISLLKNEYGNAVRCIFTTNIDYKVLDINEDIDEKKLEDFRKETEGMSNLVFDFKLNKTKLISDKFSNVHNECNLFLFFFTNALLKCLNVNLSELENSFWETKLKSTYKVLLIILDHDIWLNGTYIAIIGSHQISRLTDAIFKPSKEENEKIQNMYDVCQKNLHWQAQWVEFLTPLHLKVNEKIPYDDPVYNAFLIHQVNLIILYTAYRTKGVGNTPSSSTYACTNQSVDLKLNEPLDKIENYIIANAEYLMESLEWVYDIKWSDDRLRFMQIIVTKYLHSDSPITRYSLFLINAINIFDQMKWQWQAFMEGKVDNYMSQVVALENYVSNTVQEYNNQITSITKSLSDNMLAAVGVSIGAIIIGISKNDSSILLTFSLLIYACYIFIFLLFFNMKPRWEQYKTSRDNFKERKEIFEEKLYPDKVNEIIGSKISESEDRFEWWFWATVEAYFVVFLFFIFAAIWALSLG